MDIHYVISWMVGAFLLTQFTRSFQHPLVTGRSYRLACPAIGLVMLITGRSRPELLGVVSAALVGLFVVIPSLGSKWIERQLQKRRHTGPELLAHILRLIHPGDGLWDLPALIRILHLWAINRPNEAEAIWKRLPVERLVREPYARTLVFQIAGAFHEWERVLNCSRALSGQDSITDLYFPVLEVRALGELKRHAEQLSALEGFLDLGPPNQYAATAALFTAASFGHTEFTDYLLNGPLNSLPLETQRFWRATALQYAGRAVEAEAEFRLMDPTAEPRTRRAIARRLADAVAPAIDPSLSERLVAIEVRIRHFVQWVPSNPVPYSTYGLGAAMVIYYLVSERAGGSTDNLVLFRLGALYPEAVFYGQWWRLLTAGFLHYGVVHLLLNLLGLKLLGPYVEALLGHLRFLALFLVCIVASMIGVSLLGLVGLIAPELMVGASGGIMGLVGYLGAHFLKEWIRFRSVMNWQRVQALLLALAIQVAFDLSTENVSFAGHASGAAAGFVIGMLPMLKRRRLR